MLQYIEKTTDENTTNPGIEAVSHMINRVKLKKIRFLNDFRYMWKETV